ncbi:uncharacterized protein LOC111483144 isoform X2 [Cucurbita maxima]|uniref:Uncharacterized protein LOC111483144 isoform X2 n=1 Tax=Cucurbita maxima TaxID=3661 RepID=A0A6J1JAB0_CUCMA|nr:uncharacterized protein LOC111483144 isoform X2 [Cucurbita maxima]
MEKKISDYILVSSGLGVMVAYHVWLFYRIVRHPNKTVIGINAINRRLWVRAMMEDASKNGILAVQTLRNNIMASTLLASTAIMLCSLMAVLVTSGGHSESPLVVLGDKSVFGFSIKFFAILVCFLVAFLFNVQSIRNKTVQVFWNWVHQEKLSVSCSSGDHFRHGASWKNQEKLL